MAVGLALALAAVAAGDEGSAMGDWVDFEALVAATGEEWARGRDKLLGSGDAAALATRLAPLAEAGDVDRAATARILAGWAEHGALYRQVVDVLDAVDIDRERRRVSGITGVWTRFADMAAQEWGADVLPLAWEWVLKRPDWPMWKQATGLHVIGALPDARSVPVLVAFIERTEDDGLRRLAGQILARMPREAAREPVERAHKRTSGAADVLGRASEELGR